MVMAFESDGYGVIQYRDGRCSRSLRCHRSGGNSSSRGSSDGSSGGRGGEIHHVIFSDAIVSRPATRASHQRLERGTVL
jgi:hypothetical protein